MVRNVVENYIVTLFAFGEILFRVINHVIGTEGSDKVDIAGTAHAGHIGAE